jgi:hypothetical protein
MIRLMPPNAVDLQLKVCGSASASARHAACVCGHSALRCFGGLI